MVGWGGAGGGGEPSQDGSAQAAGGQLGEEPRSRHSLGTVGVVSQGGHFCRATCAAFGQVWTRRPMGTRIMSMGPTPQCSHARLQCPG